MRGTRTISALATLATLSVACGGESTESSTTNAGGSAAQNDGSAGDAGGSSGSAGTNGGGSGGGSGGSGGTTGGAAGASGGSAGQSGSAGATGCPQSTFLDEDVIARAAVVLSSCVSDDGFWRTQTYLRGTEGGYEYFGGRDFARCLAAVTNGCDGWRDCLGLSPLLGGEVCDTCQGNVAVFCGENVLWDCTKLGATCAAGRCEIPGRQWCDLGTADRCEQGRPVHCDDVLHYGPSCAALGLECVVGSSYSTCRGTGAACTWDDSPYPDVDYTGMGCNGGTLNACVEGRTASLDCTCFGAGFSCQTAAGTAFCGSAGDCDPRTHVKTCDGNSVVFCNGGALARVDCPALGFTSCDPNQRFGCL